MELLGRCQSSVRTVDYLIWSIEIRAICFITLGINITAYYLLMKLYWNIFGLLRLQRLFHQLTTWITH